MSKRAVDEAPSHSHGKMIESFKVLLLGDSSVGKSSLMAKLMGGESGPMPTGPTMVCPP